MNPLTHEWVQKAEGDWLTARRESDAYPPNYDAVCFHAQQCTEKYLKAQLHELSIDFPKTHDLVRLINLLWSARPSLARWRDAAKSLTEYGMGSRSPSEWANDPSARAALAHCSAMRDEIRRLLGLNPENS